jgi:signal transduction histidine kinase
VGRLRALLRERPRLADALIALLLTAFTLLGGVLNEISPDGPPSSPSWTIPVVTLLAVATFWRRTRTVAVFVLVAAVSLVLAALGINDAISLPALVMLYTVASRRPRREATFAWLTMLAIGLLLILRSGETLDYAAAIALSALVTVPYAIGIAVGNRRQLVAALRDRAERAEAEVEARSRLAMLEERARISRELHDVLAHGLTVMIAQSEGAASVAEADPARAAEAMRTVASTGRESLAELRRLVAAERVEVGDAGAADLAPVPGLDDLDGLVARVRDAGLPVRLTRSGTVPDVPDDVGRAVYRVVQESLTNVLKHGGRGAHADVALTVADDALEVTVADHGGVRAGGAGSPGRGGAGLVGMRERVTMLGGELDAGPSPEGSWVVRARLPLTLAGAS